jgi:hypothetical protein
MPNTLLTQRTLHSTTDHCSPERESRGSTGCLSLRPPWSHEIVIHVSNGKHKIQHPPPKFRSTTSSFHGLCNLIFFLVLLQVVEMELYIRISNISGCGLCVRSSLQTSECMYSLPVEKGKDILCSLPSSRKSLPLVQTGKIVNSYPHLFIIL